MLYTIKGLPIGISLPRSAQEIIQNIPVKAKKVDSKFVVTKAALVEKIRGINECWADFWNNSEKDTFEFST
jgi:hypothetical protein